MQINKLLSTVKFLKPIQIRYQLYYRIVSIWERITKRKFTIKQKRSGKLLALVETVAKLKSYNVDTKEFVFLNCDKLTGSQLKLWRYNYYYMDYILQDDITPELGMDMIRSFELSKEALEPYPSSLRAMNWIKFLSFNRIDDQEISSCLYAQYRRLYQRLEYHLLGNHLLENGFSLIWAGFYFDHSKFLEKGTKIVCLQLEEQVLNDGAHFELSPMYHLIILERLLDLKNLLDNNNLAFKGRARLEDSVNTKLPLMLGWLRAISYEDCSVPMLNDSAYDIAATPEQIFEYARRLAIEPSDVRLSDCGYRKLKNNVFDAVVDVAAIGPSYIPGHAHADSLNFELKRNGKPFICDVGTSTYQDNSVRHWERSTMAHNTVVVNNRNSSDVWSAFRVGNRAITKILIDQENITQAQHDGYRDIGVTHKRRFSIGDTYFKIEDEILGASATQSYASLHFAPGVDIDNLNIDFIGELKKEYFDYQYPIGYNKYVLSHGIRVFFEGKLETVIH